MARPVARKSRGHAVTTIAPSGTAKITKTVTRGLGTTSSPVIAGELSLRRGVGGTSLRIRIATETGTARALSVTRARITAIEQNVTQSCSGPLLLVDISSRAFFKYDPAGAHAVPPRFGTRDSDRLGRSSAAHQRLRPGTDVGLLFWVGVLRWECRQLVKNG